MVRMHKMDHAGVRASTVEKYEKGVAASEAAPALSRVFPASYLSPEHDVVMLLIRVICVKATSTASGRLLRVWPTQSRLSCRRRART